MNDKDFKTAVGKFVTGVTVVSTSYQNNLFALTVNSFASVSLSPYLVSFCIHKNSKSCIALKQSTYFVINILSDDQAQIAKHFASKVENKFESIKYNLSKISQSPILDGVVCYIECKQYDHFECGDHRIFIGEVKNAVVNHKKSPLIYFAKSFTGFD